MDIDEDVVRRNGRGGGEGKEYEEPISPAWD